MALVRAVRHGCPGDSRLGRASAGMSFDGRSVRANHAVRIGSVRVTARLPSLSRRGEASVHEGRVGVIHDELADLLVAAGEVNLDLHLVVANSTDHRLPVALDDREKERPRLVGQRANARSRS